MKSRPWVWGPVAGFAVGLVVGGTMTYLDWRLNPGGIFHGRTGTNWSVVLETAWSWILPVGLLAAAFATATFSWLRRRT